VTGEAPSPNAERGLPGKQGEFAISFPWIARFALTAAIGAAVGFLVSSILAPGLIGKTSGGIIIGAAAIAATLLSIRKVHAWHLSTFADGTLVGLLVWPIAVILTAALTWPIANPMGFLALFFLHGLIAWLVLVPSGWITGFAYHLALSAVERARANDDDTA
jgi:hypothetical protein